MDETLPGEMNYTDVKKYQDSTDSLLDMLEDRLEALEEVAAARGFGRLAAAWRLGRCLRTSVRPADGNSFSERRCNAVSADWGATQTAVPRQVELWNARVAARKAAEHASSDPAYDWADVGARAPVGVLLEGD